MLHMGASSPYSLILYIALQYNRVCLSVQRWITNVPIELTFPPPVTTPNAPPLSLPYGTEFGTASLSDDQRQDHIRTWSTNTTKILFALIVLLIPCIKNAV
jgi:hypothetical protein